MRLVLQGQLPTPRYISVEGCTERGLGLGLGHQGHGFKTTATVYSWGKSLPQATQTPGTHKSWASERLPEHLGQVPHTEPGSQARPKRLLV